MRSIGLRGFGFFAVLALAALACAAPSADSLLNPLPKDDFSDNTSGWGIGTDDTSSVEYVDGGLKMAVYSTFYVVWSTPGSDVRENVHIEASVKNDSADAQATFGIVCNEQGTSSSFYYVGVSREGHYAFIRSADGQDDVYLKEGDSTVISANTESLRIGLDCGGGTLTLYVNGEKIDSVADSTYTSGVIGLFASSDDLPGGATVTFDDFVVTKLGK
jgi:hypothetical protein